MKRILYFSQVPWSWIKQRPQFLAEELAYYYDITVVTKCSFSEQKKQAEETPVKFAALYRLPFERFRLVAIISNFLCMLQVWLMAKKYDIIWTSSPSQYDIIRLVGNKIVVYDCMDDMLSFSNNTIKNNIIKKRERNLYNRANIVLSSSLFLKNKLIDRYGKKEINVVNNAIKSKINDEVIPLPEDLKKYFKKDTFTITYIGTISEWMDYELLRKIVDSDERFVINLFGPCAYKEDVPNRVNFCGSVSHDLVFSVMNESSALIMPFIVTELIRSVNPVKLYEYIYSGKPCLAPLYTESAQFGDFAYLYKDHSDCLSILHNCSNNSFVNKRSLEECRNYAKNNTWKSRTEVICQILNNTLG